MLKDNRALARLRQDEIREFVHSYFVKTLARMRSNMNSKGLPENAMDVFRDELDVYNDGIAVSDDYFTNQYIDGPTVDGFKVFARLDELTWAENEGDLRRELTKGRRDLLKLILGDLEGLESYSLEPHHGEATSRSTPPPERSISAPKHSRTLASCVADFLVEHSRHWAPKTTKQNQAYLNVMLEYFGEEKPLADITKADASALKKVLQKLPSSRNIKPALKVLPLMEVIEVTGHKLISPKTINSHIQMFASFFDWAERHGHTEQKLFVGIKVARAKRNVDMRTPFTQEQVQLIYNELVCNSSGLVRKESHKWGALLALFTGARLNEICQLNIADIRKDGDIWYLDITDDGDDNKSIKSEAGRRKVPLHKELIALGFVEFVESRKAGKRLFPDYNFNENGGYGRSLGRWCNESFLKKLGIKEPSLVFHSFRHTIVTRLGQQSVPEPVIQCLVGHARSGVTQEVYLREGYTMKQLSDAINRIAVGRG